MTADCILVTGGAGYIGSHAALALLARGWRVVVVDNLVTGVRALVPDAAAFVEADVADMAAMSRAPMPCRASSARKLSRQLGPGAAP